jgi:hypothetical protein
MLCCTFEGFIAVLKHIGTRFHRNYPFRRVLQGLNKATHGNCPCRFEGMPTSIFYYPKQPSPASFDIWIWIPRPGYANSQWPHLCSISLSQSDGPNSPSLLNAVQSSSSCRSGVWAMETPQPNRPVARDRGFSDSFTIRHRAGSEKDPTCNGPSNRGTGENRSPATLPRAFEGMLKTTTETGDIGMFSIKPYRVPQSLSTPRGIGASYSDNEMQKSRQTFQPFGVPNVDDRRRLPSYTRDTTSEVISMYETASQKSASRVFDDPDYRSYSMTQTSYSAYTLSNHRSYASLRSQQDSNGLLQRPRSPFAYPTRLKRPGFRPSSPALTDGGVVDYNRRPEIDRTPYVSCLSFSSVLFYCLRVFASPRDCNFQVQVANI